MGKTQDYGLGEFTFPRGWFMVADAEEVGPTGLRAVLCAGPRDLSREERRVVML
jgi:hypothetical protein